MTGYSWARLAKGGTTRLYLPVSEVNRVVVSKLFTADRSEGKGSITKDKRVDIHEITVQGEFVPSSDMPAEHKAAVQALFSRSVVTAEEQLRWLLALKLYVGGQFDLYLGDDQYTATSADEVIYDIDGSTYPQVVIEEVRESRDTRATRIGYTLKMRAGFESSTGET